MPEISETYSGLRRREGLLAVTVAWLSIVTLTSIAITSP